MLNKAGYQWSYSTILKLKSKSKQYTKFKYVIIIAKRSVIRVSRLKLIRIVIEISRFIIIAY